MRLLTPDLKVLAQVAWRMHHWTLNKVKLLPHGWKTRQHRIRSSSTNTHDHVGYTVKLHCDLRRFTRCLMGYLLANIQLSTTAGIDLLACEPPILRPSSSGMAS